MIKETLKEFDEKESKLIVVSFEGLSKDGVKLKVDTEKLRIWLKSKLEEVRKQEVEEIKKELLEKGHGGGNWRRVINKP